MVYSTKALVEAITQNVNSGFMVTKFDSGNVFVKSEQVAEVLGDCDEELTDGQIERVIEENCEAPVYYSDTLEWFARPNAWVKVDEALRSGNVEYEGGIMGLIETGIALAMAEEFSKVIACVVESLGGDSL